MSGVSNALRYLTIFVKLLGVMLDSEVGRTQGVISNTKKTRKIKF